MSKIFAGARVRDLASVHEWAARAAAGFKAIGIGEGGVVALLLRNDFAFFEASLATGLIGAYATPINWHFTAEETGYILADSGAGALVIHADLLARRAPAIRGRLAVFVVPTPPEILAAYRIAESDAAAPAAATDWDTWLESHEPLTGLAPPPRGSMIYTSGTTGRPKGVRKEVASAEQMALRRELLALAFGLRACEPMAVLMNGPMYHSAPNIYGLSAARLGAEIVLEARFDPEEMLALIERHRISHMHIVPVMFVRLLNLPEAVRRRYDMSSLRFVVHGAAPCAPHVKRAMIEWWGPVIHEYYGSTETGIVTCHGSAEALRKPGTAGRAIGTSIVKVFDDDGNELGPSQVGEIYVRAADTPEFTYLNQPDQRAEIGRGDLVTVGDVGWLDEEGYLFLCDRKRDMVISGGVNIYPAEIESALAEMPGVRDCAVFGIPDEEFGEALCAHIEVDRDVRLSAEAVRAFLAPKLAKYKIPKVIEFAAALPREDSGKIYKRKLRAPYWEKAGRNI